MKKFRVIYKSGEYVSTVIEADTAKEAEEKAKRMDGGDFTPYGCNRYIWEYETTEEA